MLPDMSSTPLSDDQLDDLFHDHLVDLTGLPDDMVRPRWQPEPGTHPPKTDNWVAFGVSTQDADTFAAVTHDPHGNAGLGSSKVERDELITISLSFYGPESMNLASQYREGVQLDFNRWVLDASGIALVSVGQIINLPSLLKDQWVKKRDLKVTFRRRASRTYNVPSLLGGNIVLHNEHYDTTIQTSL